MPFPLPRRTAAASDRFPSATDDPLEAVRADLRARLRVACAHMPAAEFAALVDTMARRSLRWSRRPDDEAHLPSR